eukprot:jgi/Mesvir1/2485/Mv03565-RA.1
MTDVYVLTLFSANTSTTAKTVSTEFNEWTVQIPPDPSAPILDGRWKAHVLFASIKGFVPKGTRTVIGILSDAFPCSSGDMTPIATTVATSASSSNYSITDQQNCLPVSDPFLLRDGGSVKIRVCHLDTIDQFTSSAIPNLADWTIVLRFEMLGRKTRA